MVKVLHCGVCILNLINYRAENSVTVPVLANNYLKNIVFLTEVKSASSINVYTQSDSVLSHRIAATKAVFGKDRIFLHSFATWLTNNIIKRRLLIYVMVCSPQPRRSVFSPESNNA